MRAATAALLACNAFALTGCLPMMAANVAGAAVGAARGRPTNNVGAGQLAEKACTGRAEQYGVVHVIDVEQHSTSQIIVWGTTGAETDRKSFKCSYGTKITAFSIRPIPARP